MSTRIRHYPHNTWICNYGGARKQTICEAAARFTIRRSCACAQQDKPVGACNRHLPALVAAVADLPCGHRGYEPRRTAVPMPVRVTPRR